MAADTEKNHVVRVLQDVVKSFFLHGSVLFSVGLEALNKAACFKSNVTRAAEYGGDQWLPKRTDQKPHVEIKTNPPADSVTNGFGGLVLV